MQRTIYCTWTVFAAVCAGLLFVLLTASEVRSAPLVTDNSTPNRFSASRDWIKSAWDSQRYGKNYRVLKKPSGRAGVAKWKVNVPSRGAYDVYARWPSDPGYTKRATFRVATVAGVKTRTVSQRVNGGKWVKLGTYTMAAGDGYKVSLSSKSTSKGFIIADAVTIAKPVAAVTDSSDGSGGVTGADVVRVAKQQLGEPYVYGAAGPSSFDCSGLTQYVYKQAAGKYLPHSAAGQYDYGRSVSGSELKAGDLIFGNAGGSGIQHVGIYDGNGNMIHAGTSETDVESTPFPNSWYDVIGYRRLI